MKFVLSETKYHFSISIILGQDKLKLFYKLICTYVGRYIWRLFAGQIMHKTEYIMQVPISTR